MSIKKYKVGGMVKMSVYVEYEVDALSEAEAIEDFNLSGVAHEMAVMQPDIDVHDVTCDSVITLDK